MEDFFSFVMAHWSLWLLLVVILGAILYTEMSGVLFGATALDPQRLIALMNREQGVVIDIRQPSDFEQGHILGALNMPAEGINDNPKKLQKYRSRPLVIVCSDGSHAIKIAAKLQKDGFNTAVLRGGMHAWQREHLPLEDGSDGRS